MKRMWFRVWVGGQLRVWQLCNWFLQYDPESTQMEQDFLYAQMWYRYKLATHSYTWRPNK